MTAITEPVPAEPVGLGVWIKAGVESGWPGLADHEVPFALVLGSHIKWSTGENMRASRETLGRESGKKPRTITRYLGAFVLAGWLIVVEDNTTKGRPSVYRLGAPVDVMATLRESEPEAEPEPSPEPRPEPSHQRLTGNGQSLDTFRPKHAEGAEDGPSERSAYGLPV